MINLLRFTGGPVVILGLIAAWRHGIGSPPAWFLTTLFALELYLSNALGQPLFKSKIKQRNDSTKILIICFAEIIVQIFILIVHKLVQMLL